MPAVVLVGALLGVGEARAQQGTGALTGFVVDYPSKKPLADVAVAVESPNLQEPQVAVTDEGGFYRVPGLPPGVYSIRFDKDGYESSTQEGIRLRSDVALRINAIMAAVGGQPVETITIKVRPNVDVGSSSSGTTLNSELLKRVPVSAPGGKGSASRSFESVAQLAPGADADTYGTGVNGSSSPENHYAVDGLSVGNPGKGTVGTQLSSEFVEEVNVVTAGYMPEYGRSTGGVLNVVTKSGSNEFHGSVFSFLSPGGLEGQRTLVLREAQPVAYAQKLSYIGDFGFDLGGPIIKDKLWFYAGFDVSKTQYNIRRTIHRTRTFTNAQGEPETEVVEEPVDGQDLVADARTIQAMTKLTWSINADNRLTLSVFGTPTKSGGGATFDGTSVTRNGNYAINPLTGAPEVGGGSIGTYGSQAHQFTSTPVDASLKWNSEFLGKRLLLDVMLGTHFQADSNRAADGSSALSKSPKDLAYYYNVNWRRRSDAPGGHHSITEFEKFNHADRCSEPGFDCSVSEYASGAPRDLNEALYSRYHGSVIVSYLLNLWGHHIIKAGIDGELTSYTNDKSNRVFAESEDGSQFNDEERFGVLTGPDKVQFIDPIHKKSTATTIGGFLQDSWMIFDKVTVNLGLRYDAQYFYNTAGSVALSLPNQWSPRFGLIYDVTQSGRSKVFFNYARYYENAPLDFADVVLLGEPQLHGGHACNANDFSQQRDAQSATGCQNPANLRPNTQDNPRLPNKIYTIGGFGATLDPAIEASSSDEVSAGGEYELFPDARVGLTYTRRWINRWIEDLNPVAGLPGFDGNPGFGLGKSFPKVSRNYDAFTLFLTKGFSQGWFGPWLAQASYTLSFLRGNYAGLFAPEDDYLGPNGTADFDSPNVIINRDGYLPADRRHNIKILASKDWLIAPKQHLGTGLALRARSGGATSYLGADPNTYPMESYLAQRGTGPRLPWTFGADLQVAYRVAMVGRVGLSVTLDVFNVFNFQAVDRVNQEYTTSNYVATGKEQLKPLSQIKDPSKPMKCPATGCPTADGKVLLNDEGKPIEVSPSFGQATGYQEPRVFRFGLRGEF